MLVLLLLWMARLEEATLMSMPGGDLCYVFPSAAAWRLGRSPIPPAGLRLATGRERVPLHGSASAPGNCHTGGLLCCAGVLSGEKQRIERSYDFVQVGG